MAMTMIKLEASNGEIIEIEESAAKMSSVLRHILEDNVYKVKPISCTSVDSVSLKEVVKYCSHHTSHDQPCAVWEQEFKNGIDGFPKLFKLIKASHYLDIEDLLELTIQKAVEMVKDLSLDQVRQVFNLTNDFTEEEEALLRQRFQWAFQ